MGPARIAPRHLAGSMVALALVAVAATAGVACTSFCFDTPDGPVVGANLDLRFDEGLVFVNRRGIAKQGYMLNTEGEVAHWVSRYGSVTFNLVGRELPWSGMNEAGLVASGLMLTVTGLPAEDERYPMSSATWTQHVLDTCGTVDEVIAAQDSIRLKGDAVHFLVVGATGNSVVVEFLGGEKIIHAGEHLPVRALANATYRDCLQYIEHGVVPSFNPGASAQRVAAAHHWSDRFDPASGIAATDWALGVLTEAVVDPKKWWKVLFREPYTRWSVAYDVAGREIRFLTEASPAVRSLAFANLDFACDAPALMMDVNAELEGPVESSLQQYDAVWNHEVAREFLARWGSSLSDEEVTQLTTFLEGFECAPQGSIERSGLHRGASR